MHRVCIKDVVFSVGRSCASGQLIAASAMPSRACNIAAGQRGGGWVKERPRAYLPRERAIGFFAPSSASFLSARIFRAT